jgi:hypothetical protein
MDAPTITVSDPLIARCITCAQLIRRVDAYFGSYYVHWASWPEDTHRAWPAPRLPLIEVQLGTTSARPGI